MMSMRPSFADHFSTSAAAYRQARPGYPPALFQWLCSLPQTPTQAWDCGSGSGQASRGLARHFPHVLASDPSAKQLAEAPPTRGITYICAPAERAPLPDQSVDLTLAAQAAHWFDLDAFYAQVRRVSRPGAILALVTYGPFEASGQLGAALEAYYTGPLHAHWPAERAHVEAGYQTLPFPFAEIDSPAFAMRVRWPFDRLATYLETWSALKAYRDVLGHDPLPAMIAPIRDAWGDPNARREIRWPLSLRVGWVTGPA
jgi:SAM-dependent methyltransferase